MRISRGCLMGARTSWTVTLVVSLFLAGPTSQAAPQKPKPKVNAAFVKAPAQAEYLAIAQKAYDDSFDDKKKAAETQAMLKKEFVDAVGALRLAARGTLLAALERPAGLAMLAQAALTSPDDPLIATNLGAALSQAGEKESALKLHLYAVERAPRLLPALTNLGVAYADFGENGLARMRLQLAVTIDRYYCPAWNALAIVDMNDRRYEDAVKDYLGGFPCRAKKMKKNDKVKQGHGPPIEPPTPGEGPGSSEGGGGGPKRSGSGVFECREFPNWSTVEAFMFAKNTQWKKELLDLTNDATAAMKPTAMASIGSAITPDADVPDALDILERRYRDAYEKLTKQHKQEVDALDKKLAKTISDSLAEFQRVNLQPLAQGSTAPIERTKQLKSAHCKAVKQLQGTQFVEWRTMEKKYYDQVCGLLRLHWNEAAQWLAMVQDDERRAFFQGMVELHLWGKLQPLPMIYDARALMYATQRMTPVGGCEKDEPPPAPQKGVGKVKGECRMPSGTIEAGDCSVSLEACKSVGAECGKDVAGPFGVKAGGKYQFEDKELTLSVGSYAGVNADGSVVKGSASFETTGNLVLQDGHFKRLSFTVGPSASASAGAPDGKLVLKNFDDKIEFTILDDKMLSNPLRMFSLENTPDEAAPAPDEVFKLDPSKLK